MVAAPLVAPGVSLGRGATIVGTFMAGPYSKRIGRSAWAPLVAAAVAACGTSVAHPAGCTPPATPRPPGATSDNVTATADRAIAAPGTTVSFTVVARGPRHFSAACDRPLSLLVSDAGQLTVYSAGSESGTSSPCGSVTLTANRQAVYNVAWPVDRTLPPGAYTATLILGDTPSLTLQVRVGTMKTSC